MTGQGFDAVVLAGGEARRLGGVDKPSLEIGGLSLLDRVLAACARAATTVCVGPVRPTRRAVRWVRESPPGGGPVAALAAGLEFTDAAHVLLLAADLPFLDGALVHSLWIGALEADGAVLVDADQREQWLAGCYQRTVLLRELERARGEGGPTGYPLRQLVGALSLRRVADPDGRHVDCDTWEDVRHVRRLVGDGGEDRRTSRVESES